MHGVVTDDIRFAQIPRCGHSMTSSLGTARIGNIGKKVGQRLHLFLKTLLFKRTGRTRTSDRFNTVTLGMKCHMSAYKPNPKAFDQIFPDSNVFYVHPARTTKDVIPQVVLPVLRVQHLVL